MRTRSAGNPVVDIVMLVLAVLSVALLTYVLLGDVPAGTARVVFAADTAICGVFLVEFLWRWRTARWDRRFPLRHWYEVLGMIPIAHPALRGLRLLRVVVLLFRLARATDRVFGEKATQRFVERFSRPIVTAIKQPITIAVLDRWPKCSKRDAIRNIAHSVDEHRELLRDIVGESEERPAAGRFVAVTVPRRDHPFACGHHHQVLLEVLADPRMDVFFAHAVRENQLRSRGCGTRTA